MKSEFEIYKETLIGVGPKMKELILDRAAQNVRIDLLELKALVKIAYPEEA